MVQFHPVRPTFSLRHLCRMILFRHQNFKTGKFIELHFNSNGDASVKRGEEKGNFSLETIFSSKVSAREYYLQIVIRDYESVTP